MGWIFEIPLWVVIVFALSIIVNITLSIYWWQAHRNECRLQNAVSKLQHQVEEFGKISRQLTELAQDEQRRCMHILDRVLTEREKEEVAEDVENYGYSPSSTVRCRDAVSE